MRLRSTVAIPAGSPIDAALESEADAILVTLADAGHNVEDLRAAAQYALPRIREAGKLAAVMVNHPRTQLLRGDLEAVVTPDLGTVFLPHTVEPQDMRDLAVALREFEYNRDIEPGSVRVFAVIDNARGLLRAAEIVQSVPRVAGLMFAGRLYAEDTGARHEEAGPRLSYARGAVVAAARGHAALPLVESSGLELVNLAEHGFAGAVISDPRFAAGANAAFTPSANLRERAQQELDAYDAARSAGDGVARYGSGVVDGDAARRARQTLEG